MRRFLSLAAVLTALWSGWWWLAATGFEQQFNAWAQSPQATGWQPDFARLDMKGYPLRLLARVEEPTLSNPARGLSVQASALDLRAPAYWPGHVSLRLPEAPITLSGPAGSASLQLADGRGALRLHPGLALELESLKIATAAWRLETDFGEIVAGDVTRASVEQDSKSVQTYHFALDAAELTPGAALRQMLALPADWPLTFDTFTAEISAGFDRPLSRAAWERQTPQPRTLNVTRLDAGWGDLWLTGSGTLDIDADGVPSGDLRLQVENWPLLLDLAEAVGWLPGGLRAQADVMSRALANLGGRPEALDLVLSFTDGQMALGPIRLGPAPRLILR